MKAVCQQYYRARNNHRSPLLVSSLGLGHFWPSQFPPRCGFSQKGRDGVRRPVLKRDLPVQPKKKLTILYFLFIIFFSF